MKYVFRQIGLSGDGAETGKFGTVKPHPIVVARVFVYKCFKHLGGVITFIFCFAAKGVEL